MFLQTVACVLLGLLTITNGQILNPPSFNLAEGKNISASATCGEGIDDRELYCKLVGANWYDNVNKHMIQGQACDYCDPNDPTGKSVHKAEYAIDGTERWWQSPPLSRGLAYGKINITIDLGQEFHVAYVFVKMANSPRPGAWILERSKDYGETYQSWQYFADTLTDCQSLFGITTTKITRDDSVICETKYHSLIPLENGEIAISLLNDRPSADNFSQSQTLQDFSKATNVRLRLMRPKTTLAHLISVTEKQDPTITRRYFYSIKDINIGGRCVCNGHANTCDITNPAVSQRLDCKCQHNTCGSQCSECCPGFLQYKWKPATVDNPHICQPCNCNGHSNDCYYDEEVDMNNKSMNMEGEMRGGGVCTNCKHNTDGINCNECKPTFYRPFNRPLNATNVCEKCDCDLKFSTGNCADGSGKCQCKENYLEPNCDECSYGYTGYPECKPCDCFRNGTIGQICEIKSGQCPCLPAYTGQTCRSCAEKFFGFPTCTPCDCNIRNSVGEKCDMKNGQCQCKTGYGGRQCSECEVGWYNYPNCQFCDCDRVGSTDEVCDPYNGRCLCKEGYDGPRCDQCKAGYFGFPKCVKCGCDPIGSISQTCDKISGKCRCLANFGNLNCSDCSAGHYGYPECKRCDCDPTGSHGSTCASDGKCYCKKNFDGEKCTACKEGFYNYPKCEECNCDPAGVIEAFEGCGSVAAGELCKCKDRVTGRICNQCKDLFWNLQPSNPLGCEDCRCKREGTVSAIGNCETRTGQCVCKENVESRNCDKCRQGSFGLTQGNLFGCSDCDCDIGGSLRDSACDLFTGQCVCRSYITGRRCDQPLNTYYYPTLYQHKLEVENGQTVSGSPARFGYDEEKYPNFSWKGYATFTESMKEVIMDFNITRRGSFFRTIFSYLNEGPEPVSGALTLTRTSAPISSAALEDDVPQVVNIHFEPTGKQNPKTDFASTKFGQIQTLYLEPGKWKASLKVDKPIEVDYIVLLPEAYYEANVLQESKSVPCRLKQPQGTLCEHYSYPNLAPDSTTAKASTGKFDNNSPVETKKYGDIDLVRNQKSDGTTALIEPKKPMTIRLDRVKRGKHVIVIQYHNPPEPDSSELPNEATKVITEVSTPTKSSGEAVLSDCPYSWFCRVAVTSDVGEVIPFDFDSSSMDVSISAEKLPENTTLVIESITAIPAEEWSLDYVTPRFKCIYKDNNCIQSSYPLLSGGSKIEIEKDQNGERVLTLEAPPRPLNAPLTAVSGPAQVVWLNSSGPVVEFRGNVPRSFSHLILHYYQNDTAEFDLDVTISKPSSNDHYSSTVHADYCPNQAGCRTFIRQRDTNSSVFLLEDDFDVTISTPNGTNILLDYILAIPSEEPQLSEKMMNMAAQEKSLDFITTCGQNAFNMDPINASEYCKKAAFSLTMDYNTKALRCECNIKGSTSYECEKFGGQCSCKPNVIGRKCDECKTGYFGFPNCKPCNCPSTAYCHPSTGKCICPPRVTGETCDACMPFTFGYDAMLGCEECNCHRMGVLKNKTTGKADLQCDLVSGQCPCRSNIDGRMCDKCLNGFFFFPHCQLCNCDIRGVTDEICSQQDGTCYCKEYTMGHYCDQCTPDSFNLEHSNPRGCTKCFCFGTTDRCRSSTLKLSQITDTSDEGWKVAEIRIDDQAPEIQEYSAVTSRVGDRLQATFTFAFSGDGNQRDAQLLANSVKNLYFSAPPVYLGKKITSYGGNLSYSVENFVRNADRVGSPLSFDLILVGSNLTIGYSQDEQPLSPNEPFEYNVTLVERRFRHISRAPVTREQMMMVLVNLNAIYIRGTYFLPTNGIYLTNFRMDAAVEGALDGAPIAKRVEQCYCPRNYKGSSCEECNDGYYRAKTGPYLGFCVPCQCNGHSETCDVETGICSNCTHSTHGEHCEICDGGYYGDATKGTPYDCLICPCPRPDVSNNFATSCEVSPDGMSVSCVCKEGYVPPRCDYCAAGYFGKPYELGDTCKPCNCNNNIDPSNPEACDSQTGICMTCLNNTFGPACEICAPGFYGDAIMKKDCKTCSCDPVGTDRCDHATGQCICKPNVEGELCDRCAPNHYGLDTSSPDPFSGCVPCGCAEASFSEACNPLTGQCQCQEGVTGRTCDKCESGWWQYSVNGCTSCNCGIKYSKDGTACNQETGQCECLQGVIGEKCDSCPYRWVFQEKVGCFECDPCTHFLLDDTDELANMIDPLKEDLQDASTSVFAYRRLNNVNQSVADYKIAFENQKRNPSQVNTIETKGKMKELEDFMAGLESNSSSLAKRAIAVSQDSSNVLTLAEEEKGAVKEAISASTRVTLELAILQNSFENPSLIQDVDRKISESEQILDYLKTLEESGQLANATLERDESQKLREVVDLFSLPATKIQSGLNETSKSREKMHSIFQELYTSSADSMAKAVEAEKLNILARKNKFSAENDMIRAAETLNSVNISVSDARANLSSAETSLVQYQSQVHDVNLSVRKLKEKKDAMKERVSQKEREPEELKDRVDSMKVHAYKLERQSKELERQFKATKTSSQDAMNAATSWKLIADSLTEAEVSAEEATKAVTALQERKNATKENAVETKDNSASLEQKARELNLQISQELMSPLNEALQLIDALDEQQKDMEAHHERIEKELEELKSRGIETASKAATSIADDKLQQSSETTRSLDGLENEISEKAKEASSMPILYQSMTNDMETAKSYADRVISLLPDLNNLTDKVDRKLPRIEKVQEQISTTVDDLRKKIAIARGLANRIELGVDFWDNTTIQLRNPDNLMTSGTYTKFSLAFKTKEYNALLAYIGNPIAIVPSRKRRSTNYLNDDSTSSYDYMALEIRNGQTLLTVDLGSGPERVENGLLVANDAWHDVIVERVGNVVKLVVSGQQQEAAEKSLEGTSHVFNLDPLRSKIYVGGIPEGVVVQQTIINRKFVGSMANVAFGDTSLGLWNFGEASENKNGVEPRSTAMDGSTTAGGLRFDGNSYVIIARDRYDFSKETYMQLQLKTFAKEGLLFLIGNDRTDYMALSISEGKIVMNYDLGSGYTKLTSKDNTMYNDGNWHSIEISRIEKEALLKIDGVEVDVKEAIGIQSTLETDDNIYFGGYPSLHSYPEVTNMDFEGCIKDVQLGTRKLDLSSNKEASAKIMKGCPTTVSREASFTNDTGYIEMPLKQDINPSAVVMLKYRTTERNGLLFYTANSDHTSFLALFLVEGQLRLQSRALGEDSKPMDDVVVSSNTYVGDSWHYVTVTRDVTTLRLEVDDIAEDIAEKKGLSERLTIYSEEKTVNVYFGGVPVNTIYVLSSIGLPTAYVGCFGDVTINGHLQNFANSPDRPKASLASCPLTESSELTNIIQNPSANKPNGEGSSNTLGEDEEEVTEPSVTLPGCGLPIKPVKDLSVTKEDGIRFGNSLDSRSEFTLSRPSSLNDNSIFSIDFKTSEENGVILYVSDMKHIDFVGLYLTEGSLVYSWNCGGGIGSVKSERTYNDSEWHTATFSLTAQTGRLEVDGKEIGTSTSGGLAKSLNVRSPVFVGGIPDESMKPARPNLNEVVTSFPGCLRNFYIQKVLIPFRESMPFNAQPCSSQVEQGMFFHSEGKAYVILKETFRVGERIKIEMKIKPRTREGIIMSVHTTRGQSRDFLVLEMVDGRITFTVDNGAGSISVQSPVPTSPLCDGEWHTIQAVKEKNLVTLSVDGGPHELGMGVGGVSSTDTSDPLYIGGIPEDDSNSEGLNTREQFVGCIKDISISERPLPISEAKINGQVTLNTCSTM